MSARWSTAPADGTITHHSLHGVKRLLDLNHHRMRDTSLPQLTKIVTDNGLPGLGHPGSQRLAPVGEVQLSGFCGPLKHHQRVGTVGLE